MDKYFILWNFYKTNRKRKRKVAVCHWARKATVQRAQREKSPRRAGVHARFLNLTGGTELPVGEREARQR